MSEPASNGTEPTVPVSNAPVVLRVLLSVLLLLPGMAGVAVLAGVTGIWIYEGYRFLGSDREWMALFIIPSVVFILFSVVTVGIVLRFARWRKAPVASVVLAIISVVSIVMGYQLMLDAITPDDTETPIIMLVASVVALIVVSGPPFLHWWNAHRTAEPPRN